MPGGLLCGRTTISSGRTMPDRGWCVRSDVALYRHLRTNPHWTQEGVGSLAEQATRHAFDIANDRRRYREYCRTEAEFRVWVYAVALNEALRLLIRHRYGEPRFRLLCADQRPRPRVEIPRSARVPETLRVCCTSAPRRSGGRLARPLGLCSRFSASPMRRRLASGGACRGSHLETERTMNTNSDYQMTPEQRELLTNLRLSDEATQGQPQLPARMVAFARDYLSLLLVDDRAEMAHVELLQELYQTPFSYPLTCAGSGKGNHGPRSWSPQAFGTTSSCQSREPATWPSTDQASCRATSWRSCS